MYFNVTLGPEGMLQLPHEILASRQWEEGSTITVRSNSDGVLLNERAEAQRRANAELGA